MRSKIRLKTFAREKKPLLEVLEIPASETVFFSADGSVDFLCGKCDTLLAKAIDLDMIKKCLLKCNVCQSLNETQ